MSRVSRKAVGFGKCFRLGILLVAAISPTITVGQPKRTKIHGFWVAGSAAVTVKPDEAFVFMVIRGSAPGASEALAENERLTRQVDQAIVGMGLEGKHRFTANRFSSGRGSTLALRPFDPRGLQEPVAFEVRKYVFVTFDAADLSSPAFDQTLAATIDGLSRAGAQQPELPPQLGQMRIAGPVLFSVKDSGPGLREAVRQAAERARAIGQEVPGIQGSLSIKSSTRG